MIRGDKNFDGLVDRFEANIYQTIKGEWRLKLLREDLQAFYDRPTSLNIWDAGCGFAQISLDLAAAGNQLSLCDLSAEMLQRARQNFQAAALDAQFFHAAAQDLAQQPEFGPFDLVLLHAVLEWLADPIASLQAIIQQVKPGGWLSLLFYNRNALVYRNAMRGEWRWRLLLDNAYMGKGKRLTPPNPQYAHEIIALIQQSGFNITQQTGIRVFYDYVPPTIMAGSVNDELMELEYRYCRLPTYRDMGRYVHLLAQRQT